MYIESTDRNVAYLNKYSVPTANVLEHHSVEIPYSGFFRGGGGGDFHGFRG